MDRKEAMAKAKEYTSSLPPDHWEKSTVARDQFEIRYAGILRFDADFNEWLQFRSKPNETETDQQQSERDDYEDGLVHRILTAPMDCTESIFRKIEVASYWITRDCEISWGDLSALTVLQAIKADILRHGLLREKYLYEK
jgi:hypothetical protein